MTRITIAPDRPDREEVFALLQAHLAFAHGQSHPDDVHALDASALLDPSVRFFSASGEDGELLGIGALKRLTATHGEIKSMHTAAAARGQGVAGAILEHLLATATAAGMTRISLETGTMAGFAPARALYRRFGFAECPPFGDYRATEVSVCMTKQLAPDGRDGRKG